MTRTASDLTTRDFALLDARHLAAALRAHFDALKEAGLKEVELREFDAVIATADKLNVLDSISAQVALDQSRQEVRDRLGEFRRWSIVVARLPKGVDQPAWRALKLNVEFPTDDRQLAAFMKGLPAGLRKYSARLAARSFSKEKQQALLDAYAEFLKLNNEVRAQKSSRKSNSSARSAAFATLHSYTRHYRELGLAAFHGTVAESDFRRVAKEHKKKKAEAGSGGGSGGAGESESASKRKGKRDKAASGEGAGPGAES